jgi:hypothetical protein
LIWRRGTSLVLSVLSARADDEADDGVDGAKACDAETNAVKQSAVIFMMNGRKGKFGWWR